MYHVPIAPEGSRGNPGNQHSRMDGRNSCNACSAQATQKHLPREVHVLMKCAAWRRRRVTGRRTTGTEATSVCEGEGCGGRDAICTSSCLSRIAEGYLSFNVDGMRSETEVKEVLRHWCERCSSLVRHWCERCSSLVIAAPTIPRKL